MCIYCYKRQVRLNKRIEAGKPIKNVGELMAELRSLPADSKVMLFDDIGLYKPTSVEFVRYTLKDTEFDTKKYDNTVVIS